MHAIKLVADLADAAARIRGAAALAAGMGAEALLIFVEDSEVEELLPAPGLPQTIAGGSEWRAFLRQCRTPGLHEGRVAYPVSGSLASVVACSGSGVALVFVGAGCDPVQIEQIVELLPLLGATLRAEHALTAATGEIRVARQDAHHAVTLAASLDTVRSDLERQAKSLAEAHGRAEEAARTKDEFLAMLGHELRNPLAPILTALRMMRLKGHTSREQHILERQVVQLMRLVDDLLDVSRIARGKVELRRERLELSAVIVQAVEAASPLFEQKNQKLTVEVPTLGLLVDADPDRLAQVFSNLLTNAAKYSATSTHVVLSASRADQSVVVRVKDEGFGIEPHMLESIFEQFIQQQQSVERSQGGLGLGLAIVKNLVTRHGGTVRAVSDGLGTGSELIVELPWAGAAEPTSASSDQPSAIVSSPSPAAGNGERVLVVDDNEDAAEMLSEALTDAGYLVSTAYDGPSALLVAEGFRPQIALLDIGLPIMDGYELGRRLRVDHQLLRLVALTGYGQASDKVRSSEAGFDAHLVKPIEFGRLERLLKGFRPNQPRN
ncbi:MAG: ATP-binding protein [Thermoanaerobaculia bacterium]